MSTLLYGCKTWTIYQRYAKKLNRFHLNCLRTLLKIKWQDKNPDTEVLARVDMMSLHNLLMKYQLWWTGHVIKMPSLPEKLPVGELKSGKRSRVGLKKHFKGTLKASPKRFKVDVDNWESLTQERDIWRRIIVDGAVTSESDRFKKAENCE